MHKYSQKELQEILKEINNDTETIVIEEDENTDDVRLKRNDKYVMLRKQPFMKNRRRFVTNTR